MFEAYKFNSWTEVLDEQEELLLEELERLKDVANVWDFIESYESLIDAIDTDTEQYTEWEDVGDSFHYSCSDWRCEIDTRFRPIVEKWFDDFCNRAKESKIDYSDYIENFWK
ncbi:MAG: hypothetical protein ACI4EE_12965 [Lachnospiraceae bacterium]